MPPTDEIVGTPRRTSRAASDANDPRGATKEIRRLSSLIEISQAIPFFGRDASVWDWVADSAAILVGLGLAALIERRLPALFAA